MSALPSSALEHSSASRGAHSLSKAMLFTATGLVWLIGSFHTSPEVKLSIKKVTRSPSRAINLFGISAGGSPPEIDVSP